VCLETIVMMNAQYIGYERSMQDCCYIQTAVTLIQETSTKIKLNIKLQFQVVLICLLLDFLSVLIHLQ